MTLLPDIDNESNYLSKLRFKDGSALTEKEIKKFINTGFTKNKADVIEIAGLVDDIGIKETITFLEDHKGETFLTVLKKSNLFSEARRKYYLDLTAPFRSFSDMKEGIVKCPKCGSKKTKTISIPTRAADEPATEFSSCVCGHNWRRN
jgi:DNA-directed RNA polymerase subunit M/transcription elongation factor TFIIS